MMALVRQQAVTAAAIRRMQSNADPEVASIREDSAVVERILLRLPKGEQREQLRQALKQLRSEVEGAAAAAKLPLTTTRAGKVQKRKNGRPEGQRQVTALHPGRKPNKKRALVQQQAQQGGDHGDEFKAKKKKGKHTIKVRPLGYACNAVLQHRPPASKRGCLPTASAPPCPTPLDRSSVAPPYQATSQAHFSATARSTGVTTLTWRRRRRRQP